MKRIYEVVRLRRIEWVDMVDIKIIRGGGFEVDENDLNTLYEILKINDKGLTLNTISS